MNIEETKVLITHSIVTGVKNIKGKRERTIISGNNIRKHLTTINKDQKWLAKKCQTNEAHISRIINNKHRSISLAFAMKVSKAIKQPVDKLFTF